MSHCGMLVRGVRIRVAIMFALALWLNAVPTASADVIRVPQDVPTVRGAVSIALDGDEIIVSPGTYSGPIYCGYQKSLNIHSTDPTNWDIVNSTIIEGQGPGSGMYVVHLGSVSNYGLIRLAGFTIRNGDGSGIIGGGSNSMIEYCHIYDNSGGTPYKTASVATSPKQPTTASYSDDRRYGGGIYHCNGTI